MPAPGSKKVGSSPSCPNRVTEPSGDTVRTTRRYSGQSGSMATSWLQPSGRSTLNEPSAASVMDCHCMLVMALRLGWGTPPSRAGRAPAPVHHANSRNLHEMRGSVCFQRVQRHRRTAGAWAPSGPTSTPEDEEKAHGSDAHAREARGRVVRPVL